MAEMGVEYYPESGKRSIVLSVFFHALVVAFLFGSAYVKHAFFPRAPRLEPDKVFVMVGDTQISQMRASMPPSAVPPVSQNSSNTPITTDSPQEVQPLDIPPAPPQPLPPAPVPPPAPNPVPTPPLRQTNTPPPPQQTVSLAQFRQTHGAPTPRRTSQAPSRGAKINPSQITVNVNAQNFAVRGSSGGGSAGGRTANVTGYSGSASADELGSYIGRVYTLAKQNWVTPADISGMRLEATVRLTIDGRGKASSVKIISRSRERSFDASIEKLFNSIVFETPPRGEPLTIEFVFAAID